MWSAGDVGGDPAATMEARYRAVGVESVYPDVSGGRSTVERLDGQTNAIDVAEAVRAGGYAGCWVIMIGTNDAANVAAGGVPDLDARIAALLEVAGTMPVLWVNTVSRHTDPIWSDTQMQQFNAALARATAAHPNLRVLDWASRVRPEWLTSDGLHYTTEGPIWRAAITAAELAVPARDVVDIHH